MCFLNDNFLSEQISQTYIVKRLLDMFPFVPIQVISIVIPLRIECYVLVSVCDSIHGTEWIVYPSYVTLSEDQTLSTNNLCSVVDESKATAVIYDIPSDVVTGSGPDTSENVAYEVTKNVLTTPNPAYDVVQK